MQVVNDPDKDLEIALQRLAREQFKVKLLGEIMIDIEICKLMGCNPMEYCRQLKELIDSCYCKIKDRKKLDIGGG